MTWFGNGEKKEENTKGRRARNGNVRIRTHMRFSTCASSTTGHSSLFAVNRARRTHRNVEISVVLRFNTYNNNNNILLRLTHNVLLFSSRRRPYRFFSFLYFSRRRIYVFPTLALSLSLSLFISRSSSGRDRNRVFSARIRNVLSRLPSIFIAKINTIGGEGVLFRTKFSVYRTRFGLYTRIRATSTKYTSVGHFFAVNKR